MAKLTLPQYPLDTKPATTENHGHQAPTPFTCGLSLRDSLQSSWRGLGFQQPQLCKSTRVEDGHTQLECRISMIYHQILFDVIRWNNHFSTLSSMPNPTNLTQPHQTKIQMKTLGAKEGTPRMPAIAWAQVTRLLDSAGSTFQARLLQPQVYKSPVGEEGCPSGIGPRPWLKQNNGSCLGL